MARYIWDTCGSDDETGWTYYWTYKAMGVPVRCAHCDPNQRCHFHAQEEMAAKKEE